MKLSRTCILLGLWVSSLSKSWLFVVQAGEAELEADYSTTSSSSLFTIPLVPHHVVEQRRKRQRRRLSHTATTTAQLFQGYGTHYVDLWCGTPTPQRQTLIVDTGSAMTAFPCTMGGCNLERNHYCGADGVHHVGSVFNTSQSKSFSTVSCPDCLRQACPDRQPWGRSGARRKASTCAVEQWYREGSGWEAREARDICYLGGFHTKNNTPLLPPSSRPHHKSPPSNETVDGLNPSWASHFAFPLQFACQTKVSGAFRTQLADGIIGMQPGSSASFWKQVLSQSHKNHITSSPHDPIQPWMTHGAFSLCFSSSAAISNERRNERLARRGASAGLLTLGGADPRLNTETTMVYTRNGAPPKDRYFGVEIRNIYLMKSHSTSNLPIKILRLDVSERDLNHFQVIVDSGSTSTYLTSKAREPFQRAWNELVGSRFEADAKYDSIDHLPTIVFQLKGAFALNRPILKKQHRNSSSRLSLLVGASNNPFGSTIVDNEHPLDVLIALPPQQYCEWDERRRNCRLGIEFDSHQDSALGASTLLNYHVLFDADANRLGWARSSCNYSAIVDNSFPLDRVTTNHQSMQISNDESENIVVPDVEPDEMFPANGATNESDFAQTVQALNNASFSVNNSLSLSVPSEPEGVVQQSYEQKPSVHSPNVIETSTLSLPPIRSCWALTGMALVLVVALWQTQRRINKGRQDGRDDEDGAPSLQKS